MNNMEVARPISKTAWQRAARILFSFFICFHLAVIVILANGNSFLGRKLEPWLTPYGNLLGLNVTWTFFAPDPAHTMFVKYIVYFDDESGNEIKPPIEGYIPEEKDQITLDTSKRRLLSAIKFLIVDQKRLRSLLGPFLCRQNPGASFVSLESILEPIANLDQSSLSTLRPSEETKIMSYSQRCSAVSGDILPESNDEFDL